MAPGRAARLVILALAALVAPSSVVDGEDLLETLRRPILPPELPLEEVQAYTETRLPPMPPAESIEAWERQARRIRQDVLDRVVLRGRARQWNAASTRVEWLDTIEGGAGYRLRKVRYEALPNLWIPALLYEPAELTGKVPVSLNVNGHDRKGKAAPYKQIRCINQARRGILALNVEWLGMGQLAGSDYDHGRMNQLDLCGTSGLAPFYLAMKRGIDLLLSHEHADPERVAVAGLSGGGWQTIVISSLDPRVTLANPVAGYSSFLTRARHFADLGDSEQTPVDLATVADYTHLTAMRAPHPTLLTYNAADNCCFQAGYALPPLIAAAQPIYRLYGAENRLVSHVNHKPGNHNFEIDNRQAFYRLLGDYFYPGDPAFSGNEIPSDDELKSADELAVELPPGGAGFHSLALALSASLPAAAVLPRTRDTAQRWQYGERERLRELVRARQYDIVADRVVADGVDEAHTPELEVARWKLRVGGAWTVPAVEVSRGAANGTAILLADEGRASQAAAARTAELLAEKKRVLALDPFYFGESALARRGYLFALLVSAVGDRPLGIQASQVAAVARWVKERRGDEPLTVVAVGHRASLFALVAAALEPGAIDGAQLSGSLGSLAEVIESDWTVREAPELFCFGLLAELDIAQLAALAAPRPIAFQAPADRVRKELANLRDWYGLFGVDFDPLSRQGD